MPQAYTKMRDDCISRKRKKGKVSKKDIQECKKMAAIIFFKRTGKTPQEAESNLKDPIELDILNEQLEYFGTLEAYDKWNGESN